ncbi:MAG: hypothetical protein PHV06_05135, partial [bacterium]|nr:hypothetical protein [bacterium]
CSTYWDEFISGASMEPGPTEVNMSYVSHAIDDSVGGNNDGKVDALETVDMTITLKNNETTTVTGITGVLSTTDTYVTINSNTSAYPDVAKLKSTTSTSAYNFSVAKACPAGHVINFTLDVTTNQGSKEITFTVTVVDPAPKEVTLVYNSHSIDDSVGGNNDGEPDAGESIAMNVSLKNTNIDSATSVSATISTTNTYVTITDNSANYPDINGSNGTGTSTSSYQFDISQNCPAGEIITFNLNITANEGTWTDSFTIQVIDKYVPPPIVEVNGGAGLFNPEWSWTGTPRKIAFIQYNATGQSDIYVINSNGTLPVKISSGTEGISHVSQISWSPDDSKIIFAAGDPLKLYTLASNGSEAGNPRLLMPEGTGGTLYYKWVDPDWSNTTNQYGNVERVAVSISGDIWVFEPNAEAGSNSGTKRITNLSDPYIDQANIDKCYQPHWNNNNTEIVFVRRPAKRTNRVADTDIYKATGIQSIISGATHPIGDPDGDGIGGDWTDPRLVKVSNSTNPEYSPSYSIDGTQISYNRDSANLFNNYTFYTTPVTVVGNCNFDAYSSLSTMSSYHNPAINEGFMKWSSAGGDLFTYIEENNGTYYLRVIEDPTIGGFTRNIAKNSMLTIQDRSFTTLSISGEDASDYNQVTIKSLHTCPFIRFQEGIAPLGEYREFLADGKDVNLNDNAVIGIRFALQELKGRSKEELVICRLDGDIWKEIPSYVTIDKENLDGGIVKASIDKLGVYGIFLKGIDVKKAVADNTEIRIFPNPFKYTNPSIYTSLGEVSVVFDKINPLADEVEITIYSISGEVIAKMSEDEKLFENVSGTATTSGRAYAWNVCCRSKETVASGVYLAVIEVDGEEYIKKIAVIK